MTTVRVLQCLRFLARALSVASLLGVIMPADAEEPIRVFAAVSLTNALTDIGQAWQRKGHPALLLSFDGSDDLAEQIGRGAAADLFISANQLWMDYLDARGKIIPNTRVNILGNELVMIARSGSGIRVHIKQRFDIANAFKGKLCVGKPGYAPIGTYTKQSLEALSWWELLIDRIAEKDDAREVLRSVENGECAMGVVYAGDGTIGRKIDVIGFFPEDTHEPIVYSIALVDGARPEANSFVEYLRSSVDAAAIFSRYGFHVLNH